ncbi:Mitochondrial inner membrane protease atp23 [Thalictrum thalictroides]|uniref:Mitochondrial inner membrane protease ATP23 n=1 Tax=Thalictrum thalictroides TaxID=46969 RepID=A0A7J6X476_THATH|nr:Mitochondrial inner membrane protease atp23 [Thalictrum thalictroides]
MAEKPTSQNAQKFSSTFKGKGKTVEECEDMIRRSLRTPTVKFLRERMNKAGCYVGDNYFKAIKCDYVRAGGYSPREGVMVCSNFMTFQDEVDQVIIHELIHAYDQCRAANLDWTNCAHHACSEVHLLTLSSFVYTNY